MKEEYVKRYADMLGVSVNASKREIDTAYTNWYRKWDEKKYHTEEEYKKLFEMRNARDILFKYVDSRKPVKGYKVKEIEDAPKESVIKANNVLKLLGVTAITTVVWANILSATNSSKNNNQDNNEAVASSYASSETTNDELVEVDNSKVNDDNFMKILATNEWEKIKRIKNNNPNFAPSIYDENVVYELIRWAHHSDPNYTGDYILSNEDANARLFELVGSEYDITNIFQGLSCYDNISSLGTKIAMMDPENSSYNDEYDAYMVIQNAINNMDSNNYPEVITIYVIAKYMISDAKNDTMRDIAFDRSNLDSSKVAQCKEIFESINNNSAFKDALNAAINEDEANKTRNLKL